MAIEKFSENYRKNQERIETLTKLIDKNNGLLFTKDITEAGIPREYLLRLVNRGVLEKIDRGVYISSDSFDDEMYRLQAKYSPIIYSHNTALFIHDLTDRDPLQYTVTVPAGYNSKNISDTGVKVFTTKKELYGIGLISSKSPFERDIKIYDMERTICDLLRSRNQMDIAIVTDGVKRYAKRRDKNISKLMRYAEQFRVKNILRNYMEVLL